MTSDHLSHPRYRSDIDGLRAIAVLSVVGFHAAPGRIAGGFIGVDIFFVISGFLISTIIVGNLEKGRFSFLAFYERRIQRIFPALLCVLTFCLALGSLLLTAEQYTELGKHIAAGAGFYANFLLWMESGYFDSASSMKPLLHLWSLSIEEQFYILWPLTLWLLIKYRVNILGALIALTMASFVLNILTVTGDPTAAFYSPLTRFWELLAGAILACLVLHNTANINDALYRNRNTLSVSGAILCLIGLALIDEDRQFPGWWATLPVLGTVLLLAATEHAWINRVVLSNRVLVWFGLISYPLYLTHWPTLSFLRILEDGEIPQLIRVYAVLAAIGLSWLIYAFIEKPIRFGTRHWSKPLLLVCTMSSIWMTGFYVYQQSGMALRAGTLPLAANSGEIGHRPFFEYMDEHYYPCRPAEIALTMAVWEEFRRCYQSRDSEKNNVALLGDSHAEHLFIGLAEQLRGQDVVYYASGGAPFLGNAEFQGIFSFLSTDTEIRVVFVAAKWGQALARLDQHEQQVEFDHLVAFLTSTGRKVYLVGDVPTFQFSPSKCKYAHRFGQENICRQETPSAMLDSEHYYPLLSDVSEKYPGVTVIHPEDFFCDDDHCSMSRAGVMHYRDKNHLNVDGSKDLWLYLMSNGTLQDDINGLLSN